VSTSPPSPPPASPPAPIPLTPFERAALALTRFSNERPIPKRVMHWYLTRSIVWMRHTVGRRIFTDGLEWFHGLAPDRGVLVVANHRSFFDMYMLMIAMYWRGQGWTKQLFFPVRSNFFYEQPAGVLINYAIGGGSMYPPIFREPSKAALNQVAVDKIVGVLREPGTLVGMHPEGTRGKGPDPYELLPAQPGVGQMILAAKPLVVPLFINGLSSDFLGEIRQNYRDDRRKNPITLVFGQPIDFSDYEGQKPRAALYKRVADRARDAIIALGHKERDLRARITTGELDHSDGWLTTKPRVW